MRFISGSSLLAAAAYNAVLAPFWRLLCGYRETASHFARFELAQLSYPSQRNNSGNISWIIITYCII
ncbi:hypothetical protein [Anatilimnocola floriformis]|uniref:hypothetical protein n=1 Tax=Anatilimnocola floriformis TaxID=2948575 RepID=UPI0020C2593F|nr:hypothetical protein [Anatilimnocola floriformis]